MSEFLNSDAAVVLAIVVFAIIAVLYAIVAELRGETDWEGRDDE